MPKERLQKIMAHAGVASRRASEKLIAAGRVRLNGKAAQIGDKADPEKDEIRLDGRIIPTSTPKLIYLALHKPRGVLSTTFDEEGRRTVMHMVPHKERLYPVGRLDADSQGLMLLTNDGDLTNILTHPRYGHEKEYRVLVAKRPNPKQLNTWRNGVVLEDGHRTAPAEVRIERTQGKGAWLRVILREGRKRQIRETARVFGLPVVKLIRVRMGSLQLGSLKSGEWRELTPAEVSRLQRKVDHTQKKPRKRT